MKMNNLNCNMDQKDGQSLDSDYQCNSQLLDIQHGRIFYGVSNDIISNGIKLAKS